ncbi:MAG: pyridoxamine 5-phosphate oxidase [Rhodoferax sp.]|nr:pyridoxamine 5-phosphate oxidase [Rhodoferax sp.]
MGRAFAERAFTPRVQALQTAAGSRESYARMAQHGDAGTALGEEEADFIEARDGFYLATVGETGWPYVQFRGGPPGFLKALNSQTIAYADFRGNLQYISMGNLQGDDRVSLILMDYAAQRRLKIMGRARLVEAAADPALVAGLQVPGYRARAERAVVIAVEAFDWNCPQHITPRYTRAEIEAGA